MQPWHTPFPIWNQSVVPCPVLTVASWPTYRFSRGRSGGLVFPSLSEFSTVYCDPHSQRLGIVNKTEEDVFLDLSHFLYGCWQCEKYEYYFLYCLLMIWDCVIFVPFIFVCSFLYVCSFSYDSSKPQHKSPIIHEHFIDSAVLMVLSPLSI